MLQQTECFSSRCSKTADSGKTFQTAGSLVKPPPDFLEHRWVFICGKIGFFALLQNVRATHEVQTGASVTSACTQQQVSHQVRGLVGRHPCVCSPGGMVNPGGSWMVVCC